MAGVALGVCTVALELSGVVDGLLDAFEYVLAAHDVGQRDRVDAVEAGSAQPGLGLLAGRDQAFEGDEGERIGADRCAMRDRAGLQPSNRRKP